MSRSDMTPILLAVGVGGAVAGYYGLLGSEIQDQLKKLFKPAGGSSGSGTNAGNNTPNSGNSNNPSSGSGNTPMTEQQVVLTFPPLPAYPHTNDVPTKLAYARAQARRFLALTLRIPFDQTSDTDWIAEKSWPDWSMDCPKSPGTTYYPGPVGGWAFKVRANGKDYEYHVDYGATNPIPCF